jgi:hypothetical protein
MNTKHKNGFVLLFRSDEWYQELSAEEIQAVIDQSNAWVERLTAQGKAKGGMVLTREGAVITGNNRRTVSDGPFVESKEAIGGTLLLDVATLEEAVAIARNSPGLAYNTTIEVRPIGDECPLTACVRERSQERSLATARSPI